MIDTEVLSRQILLSEIDKEEIEKISALACEITKKIAHVISKNIRRMNDRFLGALVSY